MIISVAEFRVVTKKSISKVSQLVAIPVLTANAWER